MKLVALFGLLVLTAILGGLVLVRTAPDRAEDVHVDPLATGASSARSARRVPPRSPVFAAAPGEVFEAADAFILDWPHTTKIAEGPDPHHASYVLRTPALRFPDDTSIRVIPVEGGATIAVYSRSRLAGYDWGMNRARVDRLFDHLAATFPAAP